MHIVQRGNNRQACFFHPSDYALYLKTLFASAARCQVHIHAYLLMTNHVHLLATPAEKCSVSRMMQLLGATYVANINARYKRTGSLWEGRYKSSLDPERVEEMRFGVKKGLPTGSSLFRSQIEAALNRRLGDGIQGRPATPRGKKGL
jgi:REP element-mobilizing transposase RayT